MKRLIPAGILLLFIFCTAFFGKITVKKQCDNTLVSLESLKNDYISENIKSAEKGAELIIKEWKASEVRIAPLVNRELIEAVDTSLKGIAYGIKNKSRDNVLYNYISAEIALQQIADEQSLKLASFF